MSILIKREMPKGCWACPFAVGKHYECLFTQKSYNWGLTTRPSDCPLIEVQSPHGRLIDADAIVYTHAIARSLDDGHNWNELCVTQNELDDAPTIIDAEGSES